MPPGAGMPRVRAIHMRGSFAGRRINLSRAIAGLPPRFVLVWLPTMFACGNPVGPGAERLHIGATGIRLAVGDTMTGL